jgi:ABC-type amino acid transport substrate-binding protein
MRKEKMNYISYSNIEKMFSDVETSTLDAVIHDYPIINHYVLNDGAGKVTLAGKIFKKENYGIVFPKGSVLRDEVNTALLFLEENGTYNKLLNKWFGK